MSQNLAKEKIYIIEYYFKDNEYMIGIAKKAFEPNDIKNKKALSLWFNERHHHSEADYWKRKAELIEKELGFDEED